MKLKRNCLVLNMFLVCGALPLAFPLPSTGQDDRPLHERNTHDDLGISAIRPQEGHFVELPDGRFMVPYSVTIPGSDVVFEMVPIPGGTFKIGSPSDEAERNDDEGPQVEIAIEPFWMGKHEITWAEYKLFMRLDEVFKAFNTEGIRQVSEDREIDAVTAPSGLYDPSFTYFAGDDPATPAATMSQFAAKQYTKWLSLTAGGFYRLPSEAEWEYACRAGSTTAYYFGDDPAELDDYAWFADNSDEERQEVGGKLPNAWGLYDMHGNVAEWVLDQYDESGYENLAKNLGEPLVVNWPTKANQRAARGGSFEMSAAECRSASRLGSEDDAWQSEDPHIPASPWWFTTEPATGVGFRILRPLREPSDRAGKEKFWGADHPSIQRTLRIRLENGKGSLGIADPELPEAAAKKN
ncbi:MAG TPA: formylglycine-generating enzyme family protein [Pirellulaceae bacterium]|nr:formylglycine-generating enzyme family protein [Pirellulaceae bacterium]HMO93203.1 formylglycine-generating enzyme family protein [Pirellulaceae bacterium]HMP70034.1 formylglycine-generating enzyme family protein [Pirellulaceae bacterium]